MPLSLGMPLWLFVPYGASCKGSVTDLGTRGLLGNKLFNEWVLYEFSMNMKFIK